MSTNQQTVSDDENHKLDKYCEYNCSQEFRNLNPRQMQTRLFLDWCDNRQSIFAKKFTIQSMIENRRRRFKYNFLNVPEMRQQSFSDWCRKRQSLTQP